MLGDKPDPTLVSARRGLLDALEALGPHAQGAILVGAQAVYLHTEGIRTGVALFTKDADVMLVPPIALVPDIGAAMRSAGFEPGGQPGIWLNDGRQVDLLVPTAMTPGPGSRAARLQGHEDRAARKVSGLEGAAFDNSRMTLESLDLTDPRSAEVLVAGPASLLVAKAFKLAERATAGGDRLTNKDAFDSYRLLQLPTASIVEGFRTMAADAVASRVAQTGVASIKQLFLSEEAVGSLLAGRYVEGVGDPSIVRASVVALVADLIAALEQDAIW